MSYTGKGPTSAVSLGGWCEGGLGGDTEKKKSQVESMRAESESAVLHPRTATRRILPEAEKISSLSIHETNGLDRVLVKRRCVFVEILQDVLERACSRPIPARCSDCQALLTSSG